MSQFLLDQSYVLAVMNEKFRWLDNDFRLRNVLVAGDTLNYKTTVCVNAFCRRDGVRFYIFVRSVICQN